MKNLETDYVIVGSGAGGASVARELTAAGKKVIMIEKGKNHQITKSILNTASMYEKWNIFSRTKEGMPLSRVSTLGGCSVLFSANSANPPEWTNEVFNRNLSKEAELIKKEIGIGYFSKEFMEPWVGISRLKVAAEKNGTPLELQEKFIDRNLCRNRCDGCNIGCRTGAKWTSREWIEQSILEGMEVITEAFVEKVLIQSGKAIGVIANTPNGKIKILANKVIISSGGVGSAALLRRSGVDEAGKDFFVDPMTIIWAINKENFQNQSEMQFTYAFHNHEQNYLIANAQGKGAWAFMLYDWKKFIKVLPYFGKWNRMMGMFVKVADANSGEIFSDEKSTKTFSDKDHIAARAGLDACRKIMIDAGAIPESFVESPIIGGHPGGTVPIGKVLNQNLEVKTVRNLFVCDISVFPRSLGAAPVLTILSLGRSLGRELAQNETSLLLV